MPSLVIAPFILLGNGDGREQMRHSRALYKQVAVRYKGFLTAPCTSLRATAGEKALGQQRDNTFTSTTDSSSKYYGMN